MITIPKEIISSGIRFNDVYIERMEKWKKEFEDRIASL